MTGRMVRRADGRYQYAVTMTREEGSRKRMFFYGSTQRETRAKADEAADRLAVGSPVRDSSRSLADWLEEWRSTFLLASDRAASTKELYRGLTRRHVEPLIGQVRLEQLRPSDVTRLMLHLETAGKAASTRRNCYAALRGALDDAVINGLIAANPASRVKRPKADHHEAVSLLPGEVTRLLASAATLRYGVVLRFILGTGLRRGEALAVRWSDIDLGRGEIKIRGSLVRGDGQLSVVATKTVRSRRVISLSPATADLLRAQRAVQARERLVVGTSGRSPISYSRRSSVNRWIHATCFGPYDLRRGKADLPAIGVHTLRHTYATTALLNGVPVHVVGRNLGHSSIVITVDTYGHLTDEAARAAAIAVSDALDL
jgi:integrase